MSPRRELPREVFVELGASEVPLEQRGLASTSPHPYVTALSVTGSRPYLALSTGSGHLGAGAVFPLDHVVRADGTLDEDYGDDLVRSGAGWALDLLRRLRAGEVVTHEQVLAACRAHTGAHPVVSRLPVDPEVTSAQLTAERERRRSGG